MQQAENSTEPNLTSTGHSRTGKVVDSAIADVANFAETTTTHTSDLPLPEGHTSDQFADTSANAAQTAHQGSSHGASLADGPLDSLISPLPLPRF